MRRYESVNGEQIDRAANIAWDTISQSFVVWHGGVEHQERFTPQELVELGTELILAGMGRVRKQ